MKICFIGYTHAPRILAEAARKKGFEIVDEIYGADLVFVSQDAKTDDEGRRDLEEISAMTIYACKTATVPVILTSQVTPGFTRALNLPIYHQIETLRILDAQQRADNPEMIVIGCAKPEQSLPKNYQIYVDAFGCPIFRVSYEEAEFTKIAINNFLISQVETTNKLAVAAAKMGAKWENVALALRWDKRIGQYAYLRPGRWQDSKHLLRDYVTLNSL